LVKKFLPFEEAREYVRELGLKGAKEWFEFVKLGKCPDNIPKRPDGTYRNEFQGMTDWVGGAHVKFLTRSQLLLFEEAREYVRKLKLKSVKEWWTYCKSGKKPLTIPFAPYSAYKKEWDSFGDWLGTQVRAKKILPFKEARAYARSLNFKSKEEWLEFKKSDKIPNNIPKTPETKYVDFKGYRDWLGYDVLSGFGFLSYDDAGVQLQKMGITSVLKFKKLINDGKKPDNIPTNPANSYKKEWKGWPEFLGTKNISFIELSKNMLPFDEARTITSKLGIKTIKEWGDYCKSGKKPNIIPVQPDVKYASEWGGWAFWLGKTNEKSIRDSHYLPFEEAREYVRKIGLKRQKEWNEFKKTKKFPGNIPKNPKIYAEFTNITNWLSYSETYNFQKSTMRPFKEAREYARKLDLNGMSAYKSWVKSSSRPSDMPAAPHQCYKAEWRGYPDFLGSEKTGSKFGRSQLLPFEEAREYVRKIGLKRQKEWWVWAKNKRPSFIPFSPYTSYKSEWINLADWLGTTRTRSTSFVSFEEAREYARGLNLSAMEAWNDYVKTGKTPKNIPNSPDSTYKDEWVNWYDWLGNDDPNWSVSNVKELLRELIKSKIIYQWDEAVLYSFLLRRGI